MSTFESSGWGFGASTRPPPQEKYPIKRFEATLRKFVKVAEIDLGRLDQHRMNIARLRALGEIDGLRKEHINATRTVQQLQAHMRQIEQARSQVQDTDVPAFDKKVVPIQTKAFEAANEFLKLHGTDTDPCPQQNGTSFDIPAPNTISLPTGSQEVHLPLLDDSYVGGELQRQQQVQVDEETQESWRDLETGLNELNGVIHCFATMVSSQQEKVDNIEDNIEKASDNVQEGVTHLGTAAKWKTAMFPAFGALLGGAVGGPVGLVAGLKLGAAAAVGGGIVGLTGGTLIKKRQQRITDMELQNLSKRNAKSLPELPTETPTDSENKDLSSTS